VKLNVIAEYYDSGIMHDECAQPLAGRAIQVARYEIFVHY